MKALFLYADFLSLSSSLSQNIAQSAFSQDIIYTHFLRKRERANEFPLGSKTEDKRILEGVEYLNISLCVIFLGPL